MDKDKESDKKPVAQVKPSSTKKGPVAEVKTSSTEKSPPPKPEDIKARRIILEDDKTKGKKEDL